MRAPVSQRRLLIVALALLSCARAVAPSSRSAPLAGLELPLLPASSPRLAVAGRLGARVATVYLEPGAPLSLVSPGCSRLEPRASRVTVPQPFGAAVTLDLARVEGLDLGQGPVAPFDAGVVEERGCVLSLGGDVLAGLALRVHIASRTVSLIPSRSREAWLAQVPSSDEVEVLDVAREPTHDWPLIVVRFVQGRASYVGPLLFSTREPRTRLFEAPARAAGLRPGLELLDGLPLPEGLVLPESLARLKGLALDRVELSRRMGVAMVPVALEAGAPPHLPQGVLAPDVWGRFDAVIDLSRGMVLLHRPRLSPEGTRPHCEREGRIGEDACFELSQRRSPGGLTVGLVTWRALPEGGRVTFDFAGADPECRVGYTFPPTDRGQSLTQELPWPRLRQAFPACAASLAEATRVEPGLFQEGRLEACPGLCAYAEEVATARAVCECHPTRGDLDEEAERALLRLYRRLLEPGRPAPETEPGEPME